MFRDEISLLKAENKKQLAELSIDEQHIVKDVTRSINIFKVNSYDAQVIKRDLIGMAQELKLRDSSLKDAIGDNLKEFTNELIKSSNGPSKTEIVLKFLSKISGYFFIWFLMFSTLAYGGATWETSPFMYLFFAGMVIINFIAEGILTPIFATERGAKAGFEQFLSIWMGIAWVLIFYFFILMDNDYVIEINGGIVTGISGLVYLITKFLSRRNIRKLVKGKKNYIADLK